MTKNSKLKKQGKARFGTKLVSKVRVAGALLPSRGEGKEEINRRMPGMVGDRYRTVLTYFDTTGVAAAAGAVGSYVYSASGLYDPDITGVGHQPMGFDQMMLFYEHFVVHRAKIIVDFINNAAAAAVMTCISKRGTSSVITVENQIIEEGLIEYKVLGNKNLPNYTHRMTSTIDVSSFEGVVNVLDSHDLRGNNVSNPTEQVYWHIQCFSDDGITAVNVSQFVTIEFDCEFTEPRPAPYSLSQLKEERRLESLRRQICALELGDKRCN